jgi:hypothetical protein
VGRRILQEQLAHAHEAGLIAEYDAKGYPVRFVSPSPVRRPSASPPAVEDEKPSMPLPAPVPAPEFLPTTVREKPSLATLGTHRRTEAWQQPGLRSPTSAAQTLGIAQTSPTAGEKARKPDDAHGGGCCAKCAIM